MRLIDDRTGPEISEADVKFRHSPHMLLVFPTATACLAMGLAFAVARGQLGVAFAVPVVALAIVSVWSLRVSFLPALRAGNWVLMVRNGKLEINLRDYRARNDAERTKSVLSIDQEEILSIGKYRRLLRLPDSDGLMVTIPEEYLEIKLVDASPHEVQTAVNSRYVRGDERAPWRGYPHTTETEKNCVRVLWKSRYSSIRPSVDSAIDQLSVWFVGHSSTECVVEDPLRMDDSQFYRYIADISRNGYKLDAMKLVRMRQPTASLADVKNRVEQLGASNSRDAMHMSAP